MWRCGRFSRSLLAVVVWRRRPVRLGTSLLSHLFPTHGERNTHTLILSYIMNGWWNEMWIRIIHSSSFSLFLSVSLFLMCVSLRMVSVQLNTGCRSQSRTDAWRTRTPSSRSEKVPSSQSGERFPVRLALTTTPPNPFRPRRRTDARPPPRSSTSEVCVREGENFFTNIIKNNEQTGWWWWWWSTGAPWRMLCDLLCLSSLSTFPTDYSSHVTQSECQWSPCGSDSSRSRFLERSVSSVCLW